MTVTQTDDAGNETVSPARTFAVSTAKPPPPPDKILPEVDDEVIVSASTVTGVVVTFTIDEPVIAVAELLITNAAAKKLGFKGASASAKSKYRVLAKLTKTVTTPGKVKLTLKLSKKAKKAMKKSSRVKAILRVTTTDAALNTAVSNTQVTLKRPKR